MKFSKLKNHARAHNRSKKVLCFMFVLLGLIKTIYRQRKRAKANYI